MTPTTRELGHIVFSILSASYWPIHLLICWWYLYVFYHSLHKTCCFLVICCLSVMALLRDTSVVTAFGFSGKMMLSVTEILKSFLLAWLLFWGIGTLYWANVWIIVDSFTLDYTFPPQNLEKPLWTLERPNIALKLLEVEPKVEFFGSLFLCENFLRSSLLFLRLGLSFWGSSQSTNKFWYLGWVIDFKLILLGSPPNLLVYFRSQLGTWLSI